MNRVTIITIRGRFEHLLPFPQALHRHSMHARAVVVIIGIM